MKEEGVGEVAFDCCRYGESYRKRTRLLFVNLGEETFSAAIGRLCTCTSPHVNLSGWGVKGMSQPTHEATAYPQKFCKALAQAVKQHVQAPP